MSRNCSRTNPSNFAVEPPELDSILPGLFLYPVPTRNVIADAYLAVFAMSANFRLITRHRGFQRFRGLHVEIQKD